MGPLEGIRIVELAGIGPGPFCAMLLSDMGAEVIRVDRAAMVGLDTDRDGNDSRFNLLARGRRNIAVDLKNPAAVDAVLRLIDQADALLEGFRPGVMERLGLGPDLCLARNPKLVYGRMTGWGQDGPIAHIAGHDINYIALSGVLHSIGEAGGPPVPPLNLVGDFGGGALYLAMGVLAGIISARATGKGQVIDCSMVEGSASLMMMMYGALASGAWREERGQNRTDGGAHYYQVYETKDGEYVSVGAIEPHPALVGRHGRLDARQASREPRVDLFGPRDALAARLEVEACLAVRAVVLQQQLERRLARDQHQARLLHYRPTFPANCWAAKPRITRVGSPCQMLTRRASASASIPTTTPTSTRARSGPRRTAAAAIGPATSTRSLTRPSKPSGPI